MFWKFGDHQPACDLPMGAAPHCDRLDGSEMLDRGSDNCDSGLLLTDVAINGNEAG